MLSYGDGSPKDAGGRNWFPHRRAVQARRGGEFSGFVAAKTLGLDQVWMDLVVK